MRGMQNEGQGDVEIAAAPRFLLALSYMKRIHHHGRSLQLFIFQSSIEISIYLFVKNVC